MYVCVCVCSTLPSTEVPYPILVLVGPQGSGKKDLALKLVEEFPEYFVYGVSHTTRPMRQGEENGREYHFVTLDDFEVLLKSVSGHIVRNSITYCEHVARVYNLSTVLLTGPIPADKRVSRSLVWLQH